ncbi:MAG TPA: FAD-linked oxidase C-terminal domain-containing protein [Gaiellaceae bacterium]|jgi:D-lactate dehydrogenase (cytochrome)
MRAELDELAAHLVDGGSVILAESELDRHGSDFSIHPPHRPDVVVQPATTREVAAVVGAAARLRIPVVPFGSGTSLEGQVIPVEGGISLDLTRLDRVLAVHAADLSATVQAGVTRRRLDETVREHGLQFPVDPGADATLGGMAATNASGTTTVRYGGMRRHVLALEAVLGDGRVVRTGSRARKSSAGYDLTSLLVGSEGTLAVITELTLRLHPVEETGATVRLEFGDVDAACAAVVELVAGGVAVTRLELLDAWNVAAVNRYSGTSLPESPLLLVDLNGPPASVDADVAAVRDVAADHGATGVVVERGESERRTLWRTRHDAAHAVMATAPGKKPRSTDVCVPVSELPAAVAEARRAVDALGIDAGVSGHVADGNFHVAFMVDPGDPEELERARRLDEALVDDALARGGTCSGEHGIGIGKRAYLAREHPDLVPLYAGLKQVFDPHRILNPGKVIS